MITKAKYLVRSCLRQVRRYWDTFHHCGSDIAQWGQGRWYVRYHDGTRSTTMHYTTARDYADIFGGKVIHVNDKE